MKLTALFFFASLVCAQDFTQRGFLETGSFFYPQSAPGDSGPAVADELLRYEASYRTNTGFSFSGAFDARADTHREVERQFHVSWWDRETQRPAFAFRRLSAKYTRGRLTLELGKQLIRWGKADLLNPTDRFAPQDYLNVLQTDYLPVTAAHLTYGGQSDTVELVYTPRFTPSRVPLLDQRWAPVPAGVQLLDLGARFPGGGQYGARWNHIGRAVEYSASFFDGFNPLPLFTPTPLGPASAGLQRFYPQIRTYGAEAAIPLPWFTVKSEAAYFTSPNPLADEYLLYVIQMERQSGEWSFTAGYAGQKITSPRSLLEFAPDRGLARAFLGRAAYTLDANRSLAFQGAVRQNGDGVWLKLEYSQAFGQHWRATPSITWIHGNPADFLGQYRRNSNLALILRYSF
ncbi:MAG: hypothetical protein LAP40_21330 [Acidobacteriia bacterium]|nr:hypothetical protein [Terriglobia bacterium]